MACISKKLDPVSQNTIWTEHVKKENRVLQLNETFVITDPQKLDISPEKPNRVVPKPTPNQSVIDAATATLDGLSVLHDTHKTPPERYALPVTANMEYGFFNAIKPKPNAMFNYTVPRCEITQYANAYITDNRTGPFNNPNAAKAP